MKHSDTGWSVRDIIEELFDHDINPAAWLGTQICDETCARASSHRADYRQAVLKPVTGLWMLLPAEKQPRILPVQAVSDDQRFVRVVETLSWTSQGRKLDKDFSAIIDTHNLVSRTGPKTNFVDTPVKSFLGTKEELLQKLNGAKPHRICRAWHTH
jgi:hypothetical protein